MLDNITKGHEESLDNPGIASDPLPKTEAQNPPADGNTLFVFRHGQTHHNINKIFCGRHDSKLTEEGIKQGMELALRMKGKKIDLGIYSNLSRAKDTLDLVFEYHPGTPQEASDTLLERDYGDLTNTSKAELNNKNPELTQKYRRSWDFPPPNGESLKMVWEGRVKKFCEDIEDRIREEKINIAVSCTNNTMRLIRMHFEKLSIEEMLSIENPTAQDYAAYLIR